MVDTGVSTTVAFENNGSQDNIKRTTGKPEAIDVNKGTGKMAPKTNTHILEERQPH